MTIEPQKTVEEVLREGIGQDSAERRAEIQMQRIEAISKNSRLTRALLYFMLATTILFLISVTYFSLTSSRMMRERPFVRVQQSTQSHVVVPEYCAGDTFVFDVGVSSRVSAPDTTDERILPLPLPDQYSFLLRRSEQDYTYSFSVPDLPPGNYEVRLTSGGSSGTVGSIIIIPFAIKSCPPRDGEASPTPGS